jgi:PD-(D/E)XK endonuclease
MNTLQRGDATEAALIGALTDRGFEVLLPFSRSSAFDLGVALSPNNCYGSNASAGAFATAASFSTPWGLIMDAAPGGTADARICSECDVLRSGPHFSSRLQLRQSVIWGSG